MDEAVLNLLAPPSDPAYVKLELAIEFADPNNHYVGLSPAAVESRNESFAEELQPQMPRIRDAINSVVGATAVDEVSTPGGREDLKEDLVDELNDVLSEERVTGIYFVTFITQ
ncbi:MAG: flagellar basal body-associated FliL family protein [Dehalococcoidia bacterium]|nr:flagellar basal body-associated FliL family protein [Dehalococcoidia bacterium]